VKVSTRPAGLPYPWGDTSCREAAPLTHYSVASTSPPRELVSEHVRAEAVSYGIWNIGRERKLNLTVFEGEAPTEAAAARKARNL